MRTGAGRQETGLPVVRSLPVDRRSTRGCVGAFPSASWDSPAARTFFRSGAGLVDTPRQPVPGRLVRSTAGETGRDDRPATAEKKVQDKNGIGDDDLAVVVGASDRRYVATASRAASRPALEAPSSGWIDPSRKPAPPIVSPRNVCLFKACDGRSSSDFPGETGLKVREIRAAPPLRTDRLTTVTVEKPSHMQVKGNRPP